MTDWEDDTEESKGLEGQPCLELERGPGRIGALYAVKGETHIGNSTQAHVPTRVSPMNALHARIFRFEGAWHLQNVNPHTGTAVNGERLGAEAHALEDGDRISLDGELVVFRFRATWPALTGVTSYAASRTTTPDAPWVTFCPWSMEPRLDYAMSSDGVVRTACADGEVPTFTSRTFQRIGRLARFDDGCVIFEDDIAGVRWPDLLWRTSEQRASLDGRILFAAASLMMRGGDLRHSRMHVGWAGALAWHARAEPRRGAPPAQPSTSSPPRPRAAPHPITEHVREASRAALLVHLVASAAGCTRVGLFGEVTSDEDTEVLLDHKRTVATLPLEADVRAALTRLIEAGIASPRTLASVIERERVALGALAPADVAGLVAHLFPDELAQHRRIVDEAHLRGVEGIMKLQR